MKKVMSLLLAVMMVLSMSACGGNETTIDNDTGVSTTQNQTDVTDTSSTEQNTDTTSSDIDNNGNTDDTDVSSSTASKPNTAEPDTSKPTTTKPETSKPTTTKPETTKPSTPTHTHSYSNATCTEPAKCSCGETKGSALGHKWQNATCKAPKTCSVCKKTEGNKSVHTFDSEGKCKWCKQILPVSPDKVKNREYEWWNSFVVLSFDFATSIAAEGDYLPCSVVYSETQCGDKESHIIVNGVGSHCVAGSGPLSFTYKKTDKYITISNLESYEDMVLTVEVLSNDTIRVVNLTGNAPKGLNVGDIFK